MNLVLYEAENRISECINELTQGLPSAIIQRYSDHNMHKADYFICNNPDASQLTKAFNIKAVFLLSAGFDYYFALKNTHNCQLLNTVPCYRLEDAGMSEQMMDFATYATLKFFRRFDQYDKHTSWQPLNAYSKVDFKVGILGTGELGCKVAGRIHDLGFTVNTWNRSQKPLVNVTQFVGYSELDSFIKNTHLLINLLPLNRQTEGILNKVVFEKLAKPSYLVNLARGGHVVESDLIEALAMGVLSGAQVDVTQVEPLPSNSLLFLQPNCFVTPHIAAQTLLKESCAQICEKIKKLELHEEITGNIDWTN